MEKFRAKLKFALSYNVLYQHYLKQYDESLVRWNLTEFIPTDEWFTVNQFLFTGHDNACLILESIILENVTFISNPKPILLKIYAL